MPKFQNKYRIKTSRLSYWDYSNSGMYFVTICTKNFINYFGEVSNGSVMLSPIGNIVNKEWRNTEQIRNNIQLDKFIIMPNHVHGIIRIVETHRNASLPINEKYKNVFGPQINNPVNWDSHTSIIEEDNLFFKSHKNST